MNFLNKIAQARNILSYSKTDCKKIFCFLQELFYPLFYPYFRNEKRIMKNNDFQAFLLTKVIIYDNLITCEKRITVKKAMNE